MIKIELLYGSYDIEAHYSKNYIINDNIDIMEKIYFNPDKLIISHLPRETRLGITAFLLDKECSSKTEIGSGQLSLFDEKGEFISGEIKINLWPLFKINPRINCCEQFLMKSEKIKAKRSQQKSYLKEAINEIKSNLTTVKTEKTTSSTKRSFKIRRSRNIIKFKYLLPLKKSMGKKDNKENINKKNRINKEKKEEINDDMSDDENEKIIQPTPGFTAEKYNTNDFCYIILKFPKFATGMLHTQKKSNFL